MRRVAKAEIRQRFAEIVAFSETEQFIDTPVKRYSNGMYLRLAFAVAAHLDPEIRGSMKCLTFGDASFQGKCLDKMDNLRQAGRTVIFVSHNMPAVTLLNPRTILLEAGTVLYDGPSHAGPMPGIVRPLLNWTSQSIPSSSPAGGLRL